MSVLTLEDLLEVSMFKCKICRRRLQSPVLQVGMFGNICGGICYERSAFTDVIRNVDVETLLAKLQVPCIYKERGCTYDACYYKTCEHEKGCEFRDKTCPLTYLGKCNAVTEYFHDIPAHISRHHQEYALTGKIDDPIEVSNPTESNRDLFYLLNLDNKKFLLRTWIDSRGLCIFYAFYCFESDIDLKDVIVSFDMHWENRIFNITDTSVRHIQPDSEIRSTYDTDSAFRIPMAILKYLNCSETVKISIKIKTSVTRVSEVSNIKDQLIQPECSRCGRNIQMMYSCIVCNVTGCRSCTRIKDWLCVNHRQHIWKNLFIGQHKLLTGQNVKYKYTHKSNDFHIHENKYLFEEVTCPLKNETGCIWNGIHRNVALHMNDTHSKIVNQNNVSVTANQAIYIYFVRCGSIFTQTLNLSMNGNLSITTTRSDGSASDNCYRWEVRAKKEDTPMMMIITDMCNGDGQQKTINVKNYVTNNKLNLYSDIKLADKY